MIKDVLGLVIVIVSYEWFYKHLAIVHFQSSVLLYIIAFIGIDFSGYWIHRWNHEINIFGIDTSSTIAVKEYNLSCALRQSVSEIFAIFTLHLYQWQS